VSFGVDPLALLTSLFAIWFAYTETRKSNNILVQILQCKTTTRGSRYENRGIPFTELLVLIRNQGISLHDPKFSLSFREKTGRGWLTVPLKRRDERHGDHSEFPRGMIAEFSKKSYELEPGARQFLEHLTDVAPQSARFRLFSQGYLAKEFPVWRLRYRLAIRWNSFAYKFNRMFDRQVGESGLKRAAILPENTLDLSIPLRFFIQQLKTSEQPSVVPQRA
jgi:hypothetical protein